MLMTSRKKIMLHLDNSNKPDDRVTMRAQISLGKLLTITKRTSSENMKKDRKLNKRNTNTKKSRLRDAGKKRQ